jgi:hypothetical protein
MAKNRSLSKQRHDTAKKITTASPYGSHKSMVVQDLGDEVICEDQIGKYKTLKCRLDSGLSDPSRTNGLRLEGKVEVEQSTEEK